MTNPGATGALRRAEAITATKAIPASHVILLAKRSITSEDNSELGRIIASKQRRIIINALKNTASRQKPA